MKKTTFQAGKAGIRLLVATDHKVENLMSYVQQLAGTFGTFSLGEGNQFVFRRPLIFKERLLNRIRTRTLSYFERQQQILNSQELASIWHPPGYLLAGIKNISWGKTLIGEPPENLPVAEGASDELKKQVIQRAITRADGNKSQAARELGLHQVSLYKMAKQLGVE